VTSDLDSLLAAIRADPGNDTLRLAYADALEEDGQAEFAEFIRVQVELAVFEKDSLHWDNCLCDGGGGLCGACRDERDWKAMHDRERELWPAVRGAFEGEGFTVYLGDLLNVPPSPFASLYVSRGLPAVVRAHLQTVWDEWRRAACAG